MAPARPSLLAVALAAAAAAALLLRAEALENGPAGIAKPGEPQNMDYVLPIAPIAYQSGNVPLNPYQVNPSAPKEGAFTTTNMAGSFPNTDSRSVEPTSPNGQVGFATYARPGNAGS